MARGDGKTYRRAKIGLEVLEGRDVPSGLVGSTAVWGGLVVHSGPVKGDSAAIVGEFGKATPILFGKASPILFSKATPIIFGKATPILL